jgi:hypothetical protein
MEFFHQASPTVAMVTSNSSCRGELLRNNSQEGSEDGPCQMSHSHTSLEGREVSTPPHQPLADATQPPPSGSPTSNTELWSASDAILEERHLTLA